MGDKVALSSGGPAYRIYRFPHSVEGVACYLVPDGIPICTEEDATDHMQKTWWEESGLTDEVMKVTRVVDYVMDLVSYIRKLDRALDDATFPNKAALRQRIKDQIHQEETLLMRALMEVAAGQRPYRMKTHGE